LSVEQKSNSSGISFRTSIVIIFFKCEEKKKERTKKRETAVTAAALSVVQMISREEKDGEHSSCALEL
jgi:hypothetical protein